MERKGVIYEIASDNDYEVATWQTDVFDCYVIGPVSREEMMQMIESIYER